MTETQLRMYALAHAREIEGPTALIGTVLATAEQIFLFVTQDSGPLPTKN